jgi:hypothetical protein
MLATKATKPATAKTIENRRATSPLRMLLLPRYACRLEPIAGAGRADFPHPALRLFLRDVAASVYDLKIIADEAAYPAH